MSRLILKEVQMEFEKSNLQSTISAEFETGHLYGVLGRNGAGKTTLLNLLSGRKYPSSGAVFLDEKPIWENPTALPKIYYCGEPKDFPATMRVSRLINWIAAMRPAFSSEKAIQLCEKFDLPQDARFSSLSTGQKTAFQLAIALSSGAEFILFDEPFLGLDTNTRHLFYQELLSIFSKGSIACLFATHWVEEIESILDEILILEKGNLILKDSCEHLIQNSYQVSGPFELVDRFCSEQKVLQIQTLGGLKTATIFGPQPTVLEGLTFSKISLSELVLALTDQEGRISHA
ncbi:MAG: ABC transporter ATP-binding protein [Clostridiales bacterium]|nr:ABC transporter ATP-binding protein [Clostridiales bacterium]MCI2022359.1 ABC transporter ATP-binding protein [Clostridiales bacterium]MCI2026756.1 ABC transporter ATP-binding protein [Clostridiales bacterium]